MHPAHAAYQRIDRPVHRICPLCNGAMLPRFARNGVGIDSGYVRFDCNRCAHVADIPRGCVGEHVICFLERHNGGDGYGV